MERYDAIREIENSMLPRRRSCRAMGIPKSTYYRWKKPPRAGPRGPSWNALSAEERGHVLAMCEEWPELSPREIAVKLTDSGPFSVSESTVYRIMKRAGKIPRWPLEPVPAAKEYTEKPQHVHDQWQSDFTDFFIPAWGWYHDGGVLADRSRFLLHHELRPRERSEEVIDIYEEAVAFAKKTHGYVAKRVLTDNGKCFIADSTRSYLKFENIKPINARSRHPQTVGKLERLHRTMKDRVNLLVYDSPWQLERAINDFYRYYNYDRPHESLHNVAPADVYFGRADAILEHRRQIKARTMRERRRRYEAWKLQQAALTEANCEGTLCMGLDREKPYSSEAGECVPIL